MNYECKMDEVFVVLRFWPNEDSIELVMAFPNEKEADKFADEKQKSRDGWCYFVEKVGFKESV